MKKSSIKYRVAKPKPLSKNNQTLDRLWSMTNNQNVALLKNPIKPPQVKQK